LTPRNRAMAKGAVTSRRPRYLIRYLIIFFRFNRGDRTLIRSGGVNRPGGCVWPKHCGDGGCTPHAAIYLFRWFMRTGALFGFFSVWFFRFVASSTGTSCPLVCFGVDLQGVYIPCPPFSRLNVAVFAWALTLGIRYAPGDSR